ncbi:SDR family NAD(P)-dependent oxidoreductase [Haladaptatus sp. YSMS36]|uniref:SDR family NAD(P)-dependent oxidoreductase n=1 Tax=Haladaptatus sp. YSMS36 TaxID=3033384 RepID=UPI0023E87778|nr:SDR family NAD(P)-dependent oxidoreductase [Haladaptatus sp. YSMS36]
MGKTVVIAGVGPGLGAALARRFAVEGCELALFARSSDYIDELAAELEAGPGRAIAIPVDVADPAAVTAAFEEVHERLGPVSVLVNNASDSVWKGVHDVTPAEFEAAWRVAAVGGLLCSQAVIPDMLEAGEGTIIFTGATSSIRGKEGAIAFSAAKFAVRGMAESMARELGPVGIHVAHVVIDGQIRDPSVSDADVEGDPYQYLEPESIANSYWHLIEQEKDSWTLELDVRPHVERF